jgi:hypothetical protein
LPAELELRRIRSLAALGMTSAFDIVDSTDRLTARPPDRPTA